MCVMHTSAFYKEGPGSYLEKHKVPSLTWNLLSRKAYIRKDGAFCELQTRHLWASAEGSRIVLCNRNIMQDTDVSYRCNFKNLSSHI